MIMNKKTKEVATPSVGGKKEKAKVKPQISKADIEKSIENLRQKFEEDSKNLETFTRNSQARIDAAKSELVRMQGEFNALTELLNNYQI